MLPMFVEMKQRMRHKMTSILEILLVYYKYIIVCVIDTSTYHSKHEEDSYIIILFKFIFSCLFHQKQTVFDAWKIETKR